MRERAARRAGSPRRRSGGQPDGHIRDPAGRMADAGLTGAQDHRGHLRRRRAPRRRAAFSGARIPPPHPRPRGGGQTPDRPPTPARYLRKEHRCRRARRALHAAALLCHRRCAAAFDLCRYPRDRRRCRKPRSSARVGQAMDLTPRGHPRTPRPQQAHLPAHRRLWPFRGRQPGRRPAAFSWERTDLAEGAESGALSAARDARTPPRCNG